MKISVKRHLAGLALCTVSAASAASVAGDFVDDYRTVMKFGQVSHIVDIDNDTLLLNRDDGFYSSGMRYSYVSTLRDGHGATSFGWRIGHDMYTPTDIKLPAEFVMPPDHPYAAWLYGGVFKEEHREDGTSLRLGVDVGCLGPCAGGEWVQTEFHRLLNQPLPNGWSRQVRNEAGIVLYGETSPVRWTPVRSIDITPVATVRLGNIVTDIGAGITVRAGQLNILPGDSTFHGFFKASIRGVGHNATLEGGYFSGNNPHTVKPKRWAGEAEAGVVLRRGRYGVNAGLVRRSNEISGLPNSTGAQNFLRLQFSYTH